MQTEPTVPSARSSVIVSSVKIFLIFAATMTLFFFFMLDQYFLSRLLRRRCDAAVWVHRWGATLCFFAGIHVHRHGLPPPPGSLVAPNHLGYLDILCLAAVIPTLFVSKSEVATWPVIGPIVRLSKIPLVSRARARDLAASADTVREHLASGQCVCVFLEGTSTGGDHLLPFYSSLLQPAIHCAAPVVPAAIRYTPRRPGVSVSEDIAYWKDHMMGPHALRFFGLGGVDVDITFGEPLSSRETSRKTLADQTRAEVLKLTGFTETPNGDPCPPDAYSSQ